MPTTTTTPPTTCRSWCAHDVPANHDPESPDYHSRVLAEGQNTHSHGPVYMVTLDASDAKPTELWLAVETTTVTADQAEVIGRALIEGAACLRRDPNAARTVTLETYWNGYGYVDSEPFVPEPTPAEASAALAAAKSRRNDHVGR